MPSTNCSSCVEAHNVHLVCPKQQQSQQPDAMQLAGGYSCFLRDHLALSSWESPCFLWNGKWHLPNIWISFWSSQWEIRDTKNMPNHQPATFFFKRWRLVAHGASCNGSWISRLMEKHWRRCKAEKLTWSRACCHPSSTIHSIPVAQ